MTSIPASRSVRATTLTPRSWPSSPTLARSTRIGCGTSTPLAFLNSEFSIQNAKCLCACQGWTIVVGAPRFSEIGLESLESPRSLVDQAYEVILDALCDGTFKPGERLTQESIAARLNVSRQPVTHAFAVLKAQV